MPDRQLYRTGLHSEVVAPMAAADAADTGDIVALVAGKVRTRTAVGGTVAAFAPTFLGVVKAGARDATTGADTDMLISTDGEFEFNLATPAGAALNTGTLISAGVGNQEVLTGAAIADSIGRLVKPAALGATRVTARINSRVMAYNTPA
jgi:hypothetical protein